jgi:hypothetical protein
MSFKMMMWENNQGELVEIPKQKLDEEERLETWIEKDCSLLGLEVLIIGRQVRTPFAGRIDLLAIDIHGDVLIIELKRHRTPREIVAQVLDYASWINQLSPRDVVEIANSYLGANLAETFLNRFDSELPEAINVNHRMLIVASELDDSSERIVQYLSSRHSLDINVVFFTCFKQNGKEFVGRSWLMDPEEVEERSEGRRKSPWTGYWFVNVGEGKHRNWDDCRKYGFVAAGQGSRYSDPLKKLKIGDQIFAYMKGLGYVGFGEVTNVAAMAKDFVVAGPEKRLFDLPLTQDGIKQNADDPDRSEWVVGVQWKRTFPRSEPCYFKGLFANQNIVCKLRDQQTFDFLKSKFEIAG